MWCSNNESSNVHVCHRSAYPAPFPITAHAFTWFHSSLIEHTCNHLPSPFISSLTSVTHRLILRLQGCMVAALYTGRCPPVCPSILGTRLCRWTRKFTNSWYCSSCFQNFLHSLSSVGSPALVIVNKLPFDLHPPVCLLWPVPWQKISP